MAPDIEKAARHKDVYELERLSYVYEGNSARLQEIGAALQLMVPQLDPKTRGDELAYITKALDCPELHAARAAARAALGWPPERETTRPKVPSRPSMAGGTCPRCGRPVQGSWTVCPQCGAALVATVDEPAEPETAEQSAEQSAENYEPLDLSLRTAVGALRTVGRVLAVTGALVFWLFAECLNESMSSRSSWIVLGIAAGCLVAGLVLLRLDSAARKRIAREEGAYVPEDHADTETPTEPRQNTPKQRGSRR
jgi:zinc-ribbon domain